MRRRSITIVGAEGVGKTSFVLALGAKAPVANERQHFFWQRGMQNGNQMTTMHILRKPETLLDYEDGIFVLLFDLTQRDSLSAVTAQWAHLADVVKRRLLLVGTHADCASQREVLLSEVHEIVGEYNGYEEVCCSQEDAGILHVQLALAQWMVNGPATLAIDMPLARASICGGFPRPVVTMVTNASHCSPSSTDDRRRSRSHTASDEMSSSAIALIACSDVKLRTISKAIYDIRGAMAEKSKPLAKCRDPQMSHWLTRSRYFGPTESLRQKRWQEEQKKHQAAQGHTHHHHTSATRRQSGALKSLHVPSEPQRLTLSARRNSLHLSSISIAAYEASLMPLVDSGNTQPQHPLEASFALETQKCLARKRALRQQQRAASNDMFERSTMSSVAYLNCYDEMDMPPQLRPISPSLRQCFPRLKLSPSSPMKSPSSRFRINIEP
ncbi:hypothetical protein CCR75_007036 [Bremia lactucae]|uniref:Uncharacterized protein n=1 Tax=Bremia lactucae TaxID=4779 RepID=A0A976NZ62_BRELC|nr:hypothetical protein CCR75_007036 [Bremia lactucae]